MTTGTIAVLLWGAAITRDQNAAGYIVAAAATVVASFFLYKFLAERWN
ncbi:MAG: hypothetical protein LC749_03420 [Actinobacteria bacterium]|nr:hypothetical protein [Actinomycetota bacterium]